MVNKSSPQFFVCIKHMKQNIQRQPLKRYPTAFLTREDNLLVQQDDSLPLESFSEPSETTLSFLTSQGPTAYSHITHQDDTTREKPN